MKNLILFTSLLWVSSNAFSQKQNSSFLFDTVINARFKLLDSKSIINTIGGQLNKLIEDEQASRVQLKNNTGTEYFTLYHLNGGNANSFNEFECGLLKSHQKLYKKYKAEHFVTGNGIWLGMELDSLIKLFKGDVVKTYTNGIVIIKYELEDENNAFLKRYNAPKYQAAYYFKNKVLVKFIFGFPNL